MSDSRSVQERYAPENRCFGCGPANPKGLRIRSFEDREGLSAEWTPETHHQAWEGAVNGGILGALLDCHSNWAAALHLMREAGGGTLAPTGSAEVHVQLVCVPAS